MFTFIAGYIVGSCITFIGIMGYFAYHYYKAWKEAHDEGWDLPS